MCCRECFENEEIRSFIDANGVKVGDDWICPRCGGGDGPKLDPDMLRERFQRVIELHYIPATEVTALGEDPITPEESLSELLTQDFDVFSDQLPDGGEELLDVILQGAGERYDTGQGWARQEDDLLHESVGESWSEVEAAARRLGHSLTVGGKFMGTLDEKRAFSSLGRMLASAQHDLLPDVALFRARRGKGHTGPDLGAPPAHRATAGRANLKGQPVAYVASTLETALYEVRPSIGDIVSIAEFRLKTKARICDLTPALHCTGAFGDEDAFAVYAASVEASELRTVLGGRLASPVRSGEEDAEYLPTQFLVRMIADAGFEGVRFKSSQKGGSDSYNYVLFDPNAAEQRGKTQEIHVHKLSYSFSAGAPGSR